MPVIRNNMRKLLVLSLIAVLGIAINAQVNVPLNSNYGQYTGVPSDTIRGAVTWNKVFRIQCADKSRYTFSWTLIGDTLTGCAGDVTIQPQGSYDGTTYTNIGSATTWTSSTDVYAANTTLSTTTVTESGGVAAYLISDTTAAYLISDTTATYNMFISDSTFEDEVVAGEDTITVAEITKKSRVPEVTTKSRVAAQTWTNTNTVNFAGYDYRFIKMLFTGATNTRAEIDLVGIKVTPITIGL